MIREPLLLSVGLMILATWVVGCSEPPAMMPVSGRVLVDGEPLTTGTIRFVPESGRPSSSIILEDGSFDLAATTVDQIGPALGVPAGTYRIAVSASEIVDEGNEEVRWLAPARYADFRTSGLAVEIARPTNDILLELTWEGSEETDDEADLESSDGEEPSQPVADEVDDSTQPEPPAAASDEAREQT